MAVDRTRVVVIRGHQATPWELAPWELLPERFDVRYVLTRSNPYDVSTLALEPIRGRTLRDVLPRGRVGDAAAHAIGDRYVGLGKTLRDADVVHTEELGYWFAAEAARRKRSCSFRLVLTVWETLPLGASFRNAGARRRRALVLAETDLFLPTTERARAALRLEGVDDARISVSPPGIDVARFAVAASGETARRHVFLSVGRLVWEKGHQDVLRALAAVRQGLVGEPPPAAHSARIRIVGDGPERARLEAHAAELGLGGVVDFASVSYRDMPRVYGEASCLVLASLPMAGCSLGPLGVPRCFWEEQFGMVLPEAMAARLPILAAASGAVPEVTAGVTGEFPPGDWLELAARFVEILRAPPNRRIDYDVSLERYSRGAAAERLAAAYDEVTASPRSAGRE